MTLAQFFPGMEWIPAMLAYVIVANLAGLVLTIVGLLYRGSQAARKGGVAIVLSVFILVPLFNWLAHGVTTEGKLFLATPLVFGVTSWLASRRRRWVAGKCIACDYDLRGSASEGSCPECGATIYSSPMIDQKTRHERRVVKKILLSIFAVVFLFLGWWGLQAGLASSKTGALLSGNQGPRFESLHFENQQRRLIITDPDTLRFIEERFRKHDPMRADSGSSYRMTIDYAAGGKGRYGTRWSADGFSIVYGNSDDWPTHQIVLLPTDDRGVQEICRFMNEPIQSARGKIMRVEKTGVSFDYAPSLVAP